MGILTKFFGDDHNAFLKEGEETVRRINALEPEFEKLSEAEFPQKTAKFKERLNKGESVDDLLSEAFALCREASKRTLSQRHFDVQLIGGLALHQGTISEMKTGEGKTLAATLPVYLNALSGKGVHVVTVNDYLSRRDAAWMGQIYAYLGLTVGCLNNQASYQYDAAHVTKEKDETRDTEGSFRVIHEFLRPVTRRAAYEADITYGTNNEFGFDYLKDNLAHSMEDVVQRPGQENLWHYAIVDEVDSILIDEARTPLIISRPDEESAALYQSFARLIPKLSQREDYTIDEKTRSVLVTEAGIERVEKMLKVTNLYEGGDVRMVHHLEQALKAHALFHKDQQYVVKDGDVVEVLHG